MEQLIPYTLYPIPPPRMRIAINIVLLFLLGVIRPCTGQQLQWNKLASGIWLAKAGNPDSVNFLTTAGAEPKIIYNQRNG